VSSSIKKRLVRGVATCESLLLGRKHRFYATRLTYTSELLHELCKTKASDTCFRVLPLYFDCERITLVFHDLLEIQERFFLLLQEVYTHTDTTPLTAEVARIGQPVAVTLFGYEKCFLRGVVTATVGDGIHVYLLDLGVSFVFPGTDVRPLLSPLEMIPPFAMQCALSDQRARKVWKRLFHAQPRALAVFERIFKTPTLSTEFGSGYVYANAGLADRTRAGAVGIHLYDNAQNAVPFVHSDHTCPVCTKVVNPDADSTFVSPCGHWTCHSCTRMIALQSVNTTPNDVRRRSKLHIECPVCRFKFGLWTQHHKCRCAFTQRARQPPHGERVLP
jgi:hypothetical protein